MNEVSEMSNIAPLIHLVVRFRRMANFLLSQAQREDERIMRSDVLQAMNHLLVKGHGAIQFVDQAAQSTYIVVRGKTRYTTSTPPIDLDPADIVTFARDADENKLPLWDTCLQLANQIREASMEVYQGFGIEATTSVMQLMAESPDLIDIPTQQVICPVLPRHPAGSVSPEHFIKAVNEIQQAFIQCRLVGDSARRTVATLMFLSLHPFLSVVYKIALEEMTPFHTALAEEMKQDVVPVPRLDLGFYLTHPQIYRTSPFIVAKHTGRVLRKFAREHVHHAIGQESIVHFHERLCTALLLYQAAQYVYETLEFIGGQVPELWDLARIDADEAHRHWVEAEEMRVAIRTSLSYVAWPRRAGPDIMAPDNFFGYLDDMLSQEGADQIGPLIYDMPVRLICPTLCCDLALAWLAAKTGRHVDRHVDRTRRIAQRLEQNSQQLALSGDPNYLAIAYAILATLVRQVGQDEAAREYALHAVYANLDPRLAALLPEWDTMVEESTSDEDTSRSSRCA